MREWWSRLARRVGRRGVSLLFVGLLAAVITAGLALLTPEQRQAPTYLQLTAMAPLPVWTFAWGLSALMCWVQAFMRQDRLAFAVSSALWWLYGISFIVGSVTGINPRGWFLGLVWMAFGAWINVIATWPEPPPPLPGSSNWTVEAVVTADQSGVIRSWSAGAERLLGWAAGDAIGRSVSIIIPEDLRTAHHKAMESAHRRGALSVEGRRVLNTYALHRDGRIIPVQTTLALVSATTGTAFSAVIRLRRSDGSG